MFPRLVLTVGIFSFFSFQSFATSGTELTITRALDSIEKSSPPVFQTKRKPVMAEEDVQSVKQDVDAPGFYLKSIILTGNTLYSERELAKFYAPLINQKVTFQDLEQAAYRITQKYRQAGYSLSYAIIPKQEVEKGILMLKVVEGYVGQYILDDPDKVMDSKIKGYLDKILLSKPLHQDVLEKNLLLIRRLFGVEIKTTFTPSKKFFNGTDLIVALRRKKVVASLGVNNDQSEALGPFLGMGQVTMHNVTNHHDYLKVTSVISENRTDFQANFLKYEVPFGDKGASLKIQGNKSRSKPSGRLEYLHVKSHESAEKVVMRQPLILERDEFFSVQGGVALQNVKSRSETLLSNYTDRTRSLVLGMRYESSDQWQGDNLMDAEFSYGMDALNATVQPSFSRSRVGGSANYTRFTFSFDRLQQLGFLINNLGILLSAQGQYAGNTLLSSQRFGIGGALNRAYLPGSLTGDTAVQGKAELQYKLLFDSFVRDVTLFGFYSYARIWNRNPDPNEQFSAHAHGIGGGARVNLGGKGSCYLAYGRPLSHALAGVTVKDRVYAGFNYTL